MNITASDVMSHSFTSNHLTCSVYADDCYYGMLFVGLSRGYYLSGKTRSVTLQFFRAGVPTTKIEYESNADEFDNLWNMVLQRDVSGIVTYFKENKNVQL
jgi:hypothetical protein